MKTLYAADLDGTLLLPGAVLSPFSRTALFSLTSAGALFTAATARTPATVVGILDGTGANAPAAMMNGVLLYDLKNKKILSAEPLSKSSQEHILTCAQKHSAVSMVYTKNGDNLLVCYRPDGSELVSGFVSARNKTPYKEWLPVESYSEAKDRQVIYLAAIGSKEKLLPLAEDIKKDTSLKTVLYREVNYDDVFVFEAFSANASKGKTIRKSAERVGAERVVAFGDNLNDLPLFEGADIRIAVANAVPEIKASADFVCGANTEDGVVRYIARDLGLSL
ncbi:MAG: HAD-IIB family hydrolase [Clostridia bacterium]|nr:HAD-IIB family hydrolase [Clostridia bacterium]